MDPVELPIVYLSKGRCCFGQLFIEPDALHFLCLVDESLASANAGKAVARQFGLVGALVGAAVAGVAESRRDKARAAALARQEGLTLEERIAQHPLSRTLEAADVRSLTYSRASTPQLKLADGQAMNFPQLTPELKAALESWCAEAGIAIEQVNPLSRRTKLTIALAPVALVAVVLLAAVPFAVVRSGKVTATLAVSDQLQALAAKTLEAHPAPVGKPFPAGCAEALGTYQPHEVAAWVGPLPDEAQVRFDKDYYEYPRVASVWRQDGPYNPMRLENDRAQLLWRPSGSFTAAYKRVLESTPDWSRASTVLYGLPQVAEAKVVLAARVQKLAFTRAAPRGAFPVGRALLTIHALELRTGQPLCTGDVEVVFPPRASSVDDPEFHLAHGLPNGVMLVACALIGSSTPNSQLCELASRYAAVVPPAGAAVAGGGAP